MRQHHQFVDGDVTTINVVETVEDIEPFLRFVEERNILGVDSETTGLDIYSTTHRLRVAQFGDHTTAWVVPVERGSAFVEATKTALLSTDRLVIQNASYDLQVFDRHLGVKME